MKPGPEIRVAYGIFKAAERRVIEDGALKDVPDVETVTERVTDGIVGVLKAVLSADWIDPKWWGDPPAWQKKLKLPGEGW